MIGMQTIRFLLSALGLSLGVGMISGGLQHFVDFPKYSTFLIPVGFLVSIVFFILKFGLKPFSRFIPIICVSALISILLFGLTHTLAQNVSSSSSHHNTAQTSTHTGHQAMVDAVVNDETYLQGMIPHHVEAVQASLILVATSQNPELVTFAKKVIETQTTEITAMKKLYTQTTSKEFVSSNTYAPMMSSMNGKMGVELDQSYIKGMVEHHAGAIEMSNKVLSISQRAEIKNLAQNIVDTQTQEIMFLKEKSNKTSENTSSTQDRSHNTSNHGH
jgi:uncharacterized protein (DUF305 family)